MLCRVPRNRSIAVVGCVITVAHIYLQCLEVGVELEIQCLNIPTLHNDLLQFRVPLESQGLVILPEFVVPAATVFIQFESLQVRHILQCIE